MIFDHYELSSQLWNVVVAHDHEAIRWRLAADEAIPWAQRRVCIAGTDIETHRPHVGMASLLGDMVRGAGTW